jgi:hypothetical protein
MSKLRVGLLLLFQLVLATSASSFAEDKPSLAHRFVAIGKEVKSLSGLGSEETKDGRIILGGDVKLPNTHLYEGVRWLACADSLGKVVWSARAEEQAEGASPFLLRTDGDSIWQVGVLRNGLFRAAKFEAKSLRKEASVRVDFDPITTPAAYVGFQIGRGSAPDVQISMVQPVHDAIRLALFSSDLRVIFDKLYTMPVGSAADAAKTLASAYAIRLPDGSGYYLFLRHPLRPTAEAKPGICIICLGNDGAVKWANSYAIGYDKFEVAPHIGPDGAILMTPWGIASNGHSILIKIAPDGNLAWATNTQGLCVNLADFSGATRSYSYTQPYLYLGGHENGSSKLSSVLLAVNYENGKIEKQTKFTVSGAAAYTEKTADSVYVTFMGQPGSRQANSALLVFDPELNFRAARTVRSAELGSPLLDALSSGQLLFSYSFSARKTILAETIDKGLESAKSCDVLQKASFSFSKSSYEAKPINVVATPLPPIKITDANGKISEADLALVPLDLKSEPCGTETR